MPRPTIFVSHSHLDNTWCHEFVDALKTFGLDCWFDEKGLSGGAVWLKTIEDELQRRDIFLIVLSPVAWQSEWVQQEIMLALTTKRHIIPVLHQPTQVSGFITSYQWVNVVGQTGRAAAQAVREAVNAFMPIEPMFSSTSNTPNIRTLVVDQMYRGDFATISAAIAAANPGDRILIYPGYYAEALTIDKPLELVGDGDREDIVIEAKSNHVLMFQAVSGRVANLTLREVGGESFGVNITQGRLALEDCDINSASGSCIYIHDGADPRVRRNRIHDGRESGIVIYQQGRGLIEDNEITANGFSNKNAGVTIKESSNPTLRRNRIHSNVGPGFLINKNGLGVIDHNEIIGNGLTGIEVREASNPIIRNCHISQNTYQGIWVYGASGGTYEDNDLRDNERGAWLIDPDSAATIKRARNQE